MLMQLGSNYASAAHNTQANSLPFTAQSGGDKHCTLGAHSSRSDASKNDVPDCIIPHKKLSARR